MKSVILLLGALLLSLSFLLAGGNHDSVKPAHGGVILEVGVHVAHIEMVSDNRIGKITLYVLDKEGQSMGIGDAPRLNLTYEANGTQKKKQIVMKALNLKAGQSHEFEAHDTLLKSDHFEGKISLKINEKTYQVELRSDHHDHKGHEGHHH